MDIELRNKLIERARENGAKFGKKAELDFGAGAEWMYEQLLQNHSTPTPNERGEESFAHGVSDWLVVEESLPNHGEEVLTITEDNWYRITQFGSLGKGKFPSQVTHWMKLPEPPTNEILSDRPKLKPCYITDQTQTK